MTLAIDSVGIALYLTLGDSRNRIERVGAEAIARACPSLLPRFSLGLHDKTPRIFDRNYGGVCI